MSRTTSHVSATRAIISVARPTYWRTKIEMPRKNVPTPNAMTVRNSRSGAVAAPMARCQAPVLARGNSRATVSAPRKSSHEKSSAIGADEDEIDGR